MIFIAAIILGLVVFVAGQSGPSTPAPAPEVILESGESVEVVLGVSIDDFDYEKFEEELANAGIPEDRVFLVSLIPGPGQNKVTVTILVVDTTASLAGNFNFNAIFGGAGFSLFNFVSAIRRGPRTTTCVGGENVVVSSVLSQARQGDEVTFEVNLVGSLTSKITFNAAAVDADPLANGGAVTGATCLVNEPNPRQYTCLSTSTTSPKFLVTVRVKTGATANLKIDAVALSIGELNCASVSAEVEVTDASPLSPDCVSVVTSGKFCIGEDNRCFQNAGTCSTTAKRTVEKFDIFPMTYALSYRRVKKSGGLRNSQENNCGPRFSFVVDGIPQFISTQATFLSQGVLSFSANATLAADRDFDIKFQAVAIGCKHSTLLVFDEHPLVTFDPIGPSVQLDTVNRFSSVKF